MPDFRNIPYSSQQCRQMRLSLMRDIYKGEDKELSDIVTKEMTVYKRQGSAYGVAGMLVPIVLTYIKYPVFKPHLPGVIVGISLGYYFGALMSLDLHHKDVFNSLGKLPNIDLETRRLEVIEKCKHI